MTFEGYVMLRSPKAVWFWGHYWKGPVWLPLSQIEIKPDGGGWVVTVKKWLCNANGLIEFAELDIGDEYDG